MGEDRAGCQIEEVVLRGSTGGAGSDTENSSLPRHRGLQEKPLTPSSDGQGSGCCKVASPLGSIPGHSPQSWACGGWAQARAQGHWKDGLGAGAAGPQGATAQPPPPPHHRPGVGLHGFFLHALSQRVLKNPSLVGKSLLIVRQEIALRVWVPLSTYSFLPSTGQHLLLPTSHTAVLVPCLGDTPRLICGA